MLCRINVAQGSASCTVSVAGRLAAAHIDDLLRVCHHASGTLRIDLTDLLSVDSQGADALRRLTEEGAELCGVPPYVRQQLEIRP